jgi:hypothetical protein
MNGKLLLGTLAAIAGALIGAVVWAAITAATGYQIGYMALGVGLLAGYAMRVLAGRTRAGGIIAGVVALAGCVLGNLAATAVMVAQHEHYPIGAVLLGLARAPAFAAELLRAQFQLMDLLFYAIAVYAGYRAAVQPPAAQPVAVTAEGTTADAATADGPPPAREAASHESPAR